MNKTNKTTLVNLHLKKIREQYPTVPYLPQPKYSDKTANGLTKCIKEFLNFTGHQAERISSGGRTIDNRKTMTDVIGRTVVVGSTKYIPGTSTNGTADISSTIFGISVKIEVKIGKDRQSDAQIKYQQDVERAGGIYWIAKDYDGFIELYRGFIAKHRNIHHSSKQVKFIVVNKSIGLIQFIETLDIMILTQKQIQPYDHT